MLEAGETERLCPLSAVQFSLVWQATTRIWLPIAEHMAAVVAQRPQDARQVEALAQQVQALVSWQRGEAGRRAEGAS